MCWIASNQLSILETSFLFRIYVLYYYHIFTINVYIFQNLNYFFTFHLIKCFNVVYVSSQVQSTGCYEIVAELYMRAEKQVHKSIIAYTLKCGEAKYGQLNGKKVYLCTTSEEGQSKGVFKLKNNSADQLGQQNTSHINNEEVRITFIA